MDGMNNDIMKAIMEALNHVNSDDEGKKGKKLDVTVVEAKPPEAMMEMPEDLHDMHDDMGPPEMVDGESDDDYLARLKGMHPEDEVPVLPTDDWKPEDMADTASPSMMMKLTNLKKKSKDEEDDGDHEYR